ncbi:MAG: substrate-binding periplasmic protein [Lachnotalea sp.]
MKKCLSLLMAATLLLSVTACSSKETSVAADSTTETVTTDATTETAADTTTQTASDSVEGALEGVELSVGTSGLFAPFSYYDEDGATLIGYDLDFLAALQNILGFTIKDDAVQAMDYAALTTSVAEGKLDIALAALCATDERKKVMNFSDTYYDSGQITVINTETSPAEITGVESLTSGDYKVAVEKGTASHLYAQKNFPEECIEVHDNITTAYESLEQGKVDALLQDTPGIAYYIKTVADTKLAMVGDEFNQGQAPYAIAISFDATDTNPELVNIINKAIDKLIEDQTIKTINDKWCK